MQPAIRDDHATSRPLTLKLAETILRFARYYATISHSARPIRMTGDGASVYSKPKISQELQREHMNTRAHRAFIRVNVGLPRALGGGGPERHDKSVRTKRHLGTYNVSGIRIRG